MSKSVLYMSMSLDGYIAGPNDQPGNPGGDDFMRLHEWYGFAADAGPSEETIGSAGTMSSSKVGCTVTASSSRDSKKIDTIYPWTAWAHQALGGAIAVAMIMVELVANPDDFFWPVAAAVGARISWSQSHCVCVLPVSNCLTTKSSYASSATACALTVRTFKNPCWCAHKESLVATRPAQVDTSA